VRAAALGTEGAIPFGRGVPGLATQTGAPLTPQLPGGGWETTVIGGSVWGGAQPVGSGTRRKRVTGHGGGPSFHTGGGASLRNNSTGGGAPLNVSIGGGCIVNKRIGGGGGAAV
jgi:hypothetical protein